MDGADGEKDFESFSQTGLEISTLLVAVCSESMVGARRKKAKVRTRCGEMFFFPMHASVKLSCRDVVRVVKTEPMERRIWNRFR